MNQYISYIILLTDIINSFSSFHLNEKELSFLIYLLKGLNYWKELYFYFYYFFIEYKHYNID